MLSTEFDIMNSGIYRLFWDKITQSQTKEVLFSLNDMISMFQTINPCQIFNTNTGIDTYKRYLRIFLMDFNLKYKMNLSFNPNTEEYILINQSITIRIQIK